MSNSTPVQHEPVNPQPFSFEWNGGFSYLTYLKVKTDVTLLDQRLVIKTRNYVLGAFPGRSKSTEIALTNIKGLSVGAKINWFDLVFSILFVIVTFINMSFWPLLLTTLFVWRTFNTCICITDHNGGKIRIPTGSKAAANSFVQKVSQAANAYIEVAASAENGARLAVPQPLVPTTESNKKKTIFLFASAAVVALAILAVAVQSRGGFGDGTDNKYVEWVKEGTVPGTNLKMSQVLENKAYFSNVEWKEVREKGNDLDKFVMYQATYSEHGVKAFIRTVFQVFGEDHFEAVETSADGENLHISDWHVFLADMADKYKNTASPKEAGDEKEPQQKSAPAVQATPIPSASPTAESSNVPAPEAQEFNLKSFLEWSPPNPNVTLPLNLDGEKVNLQVGMDSPNGIKVLALSETLMEGWNLQLDTSAGSGSPFDEYGDLKEGFSLYIKDHDFENDAVPEVVIAASDGLSETYVWVFGYNYLFTELGSSPLELIWYGEGQSDVILEDNKIVLPFGSQGLFDEYVYNNNTFIKQ